MKEKETEKQDNFKGYALLEHRFNDCFEGRDILLSYHFKRPGRPQVARVQKTFSKDSINAFSTFLMEIVHLDEKEKLAADIQTYPGITATFANAILGSVGIGDLGN